MNIFIISIYCHLVWCFHWKTICFHLVKRSVCGEVNLTWDCRYCAGLHMRSISLSLRVCFRSCIPVRTCVWLKPSHTAQIKLHMWDVFRFLYIQSLAAWLSVLHNNCYGAVGFSTTHTHTHTHTRTRTRTHTHTHTRRTCCCMALQGIIHVQ